MIGVVLLFIPGPGLPLIAIGGALLARNSQWVAKTLDWSEVKGRSAVRTLQQAWKEFRGGKRRGANRPL